MPETFYILYVVEKVEGFFPRDYIFTYKTESSSLLELWDATEKALELAFIVDYVEIVERTKFLYKQTSKCCALF